MPVWGLCCYQALSRQYAPKPYAIAPNLNHTPQLVDSQAVNSIATVHIKAVSGFLFFLLLSVSPAFATKPSRQACNLHHVSGAELPSSAQPPAASRDPDSAKLAVGRPCSDSGEHGDGAVAFGRQFLSADSSGDKGCRHGRRPSIGAAERGMTALLCREPRAQDSKGLTWETGKSS